MTSNMGAQTILENFEDLDAVGDEHRGDIIETTKVEVFEKLKEHLRPEFLNRVLMSELCFCRLREMRFVRF